MAEMNCIVIFELIYDFVNSFFCYFNFNAADKLWFLVWFLPVWLQFFWFTLLIFMACLFISGLVWFSFHSFCLCWQFSMLFSGRLELNSYRSPSCILHHSEWYSSVVFSQYFSSLQRINLFCWNDERLLMQNPLVFLPGSRLLGLDSCSAWRLRR